MNREIKFRAWHSNKGSMIMPNEASGFCGSYYLSLDGSVVTDGNSGSLRNPEPYFHKGVNYVVLMQYTGLKDKNGKEIYEGDVIMRDNNYYLIEFIQGRFKAVYNGGEDKSIILGNLMWDEAEVIGNIYENSELL